MQDLTVQAGKAWVALEARALPAAPPAPPETATLPDGTEDARYNMFHAPPGSDTGGQFTTSSGAGGSSKSKQSKKPAHASAGSPQHGTSGHAEKAEAAKDKAAAEKAAKDKAARKAHLHAEAAADREKAKGLEHKLHGLQDQQKKAQAASAAAAKTAKSNASKASHINPHAKTANPGAAHTTTAKAKTGKTLKQQISDLEGQITSLYQKAQALDRQAKGL